VSSKLSLEQLKQNLAGGKYSKSQIKTMIAHLEASSAVKSKAKLAYLRENHFMSDKPFIVTRDSITMSLETKIEVLEPDLSDLGVAKKFIQVADSAKRRGIDFQLTLSDVRTLIKKKKCYYSGLPFDHKDKEKGLTFDRINSKLGYIKGNVVACRHDINQLKNLLIEHEVSVFKDNIKLLIKTVGRWEIK
jgi:hypothetical protein